MTQEERRLVNICNRSDSRVSHAVDYLHRARKELRNMPWYLDALAARSKADIVRLVMGAE